MAGRQRAMNSTNSPAGTSQSIRTAVSLSRVMEPAAPPNRICDGGDGFNSSLRPMSFQ